MREILTSELKGRQPIYSDEFSRYNELNGSLNNTKTNQQYEKESVKV